MADKYTKIIIMTASHLLEKEEQFNMFSRDIKMCVYVCKMPNRSYRDEKKLNLKMHF